MKKNADAGVFTALKAAAAAHRFLAAGTLLCVAGSVAASLLPPLLLARIIDRLTGGLPLTFAAALLYFGSLALEGVLSSAQETLLVLFGQKMTHALRSEMSRKLTRLPADTLIAQNPGEVAARFSGDVDTVEALFTSGIISMAADACRILSILAVIAVKNTGLALILLAVLPLFAVFTRHVQKRMLFAQLNNRRAVAAVAGQVPETLHNLRTIRALGLESYMERRYDRRIGESYAAVEKTNFYDAVYSPVVLLLNAAVVGIVMLLSASGKAEILTLFGMSVGTSVAVINYISRIFSPIESLGMEIQTIQSAMAGVKRIEAFLAQPERVIPPERAAAARGDIVLSHVTFGYGEKTVLHDFSLTVKAGEQVTLIGRTGAGKSTVAESLLALPGVRCLDLDRIYHELIAPGQPLVAALAAAFSDAVVRQDGTLDRRALAAAAFATPENAQKLNAVTHPAILRETARRRQALAADPAVRAVLLDAPLLFESGLDRQCDRVIAVIAPEEVRLDRIRRRDGLPEEAVLRRFLRQQPEEFYTSRADLVLDTGGGQPLAALVQQAKRQLEEWCDR